MTFKPKTTGSSSPREFEPFVAVFPKEGNRYGRVSLIVDMGIQQREDFDDGKGNVKPQKDCQQVAVFADLVNDIVDYGGKIGKQQYRLLLNKNFQGEIQGINFTTTPPKDADGITIQGKPWGFHPASALTKLAKAVGEEDIIYDVRENPKSLDIDLLLDKPALFNVEVKRTAAKGDKKDKDGNPVIYTNVNFKTVSPVPDGPDGNPMEIAPLKTPAMSITFDNATEEDIMFIRPGLRAQIKKATNYAGSQMQAAIEAFEKANGGAPAPTPPAAEPSAPPAAPAAPKRGRLAKTPPPPAGDAQDDDVPF